jgi:hypothetical protein
MTATPSETYAQRSAETPGETTRETPAQTPRHETPIPLVDRAWIDPARGRPMARPTPIGWIADAVVEKLRRPRFPLLRMEQISADRETRYLVKNVLPAEGLIVLWGRPKCGKSFWTFDLAAHIAVGIPYRGQKVRQGPVVYIAAEGAAGFNARVEAWRNRHLGTAQRATGVSGGPSLAPIPFHLLPMRLDLVSDHAAFIADVQAQLEGTPPALVVIDTLNRTYTGSESSDEDMTAYIAAADAIKTAFKCSVIVVHHCGHEASRPRGHSSLTAAADTQIAIRRDGDFVTATVEWNKDGPEGYVNVSRLDTVEIARDEDGDAVTTRVVVACEARDAEAGEAGEKKGRSALSPVLTLALQALSLAIAEHGQPYDQTNVPADTPTVPVELWRQYFYKRSLDVSPDGKQETRKKNFQKATRELQVRNLIGCWDEQVWIIGADTPGIRGTPA